MTTPVGTTRAVELDVLVPMRVRVPDLDENDAREVVQAWLDGGPKRRNWTVTPKTSGGFITAAHVKINIPGRAMP